MNGTVFFPGSFDPPTLGHVDLVTRACRLFERVVVGVGHNADKASWLGVPQRVELLRAILPAGVLVTAFEGLAVEAARAAGAGLILRGVRDGSDLSAEMRMARANRRLDAGAETLLLPASPEVAHISSRLVREVARAGGDVLLFLPAVVARALPPVRERTPEGRAR